MKLTRASVAKFALLVLFIALPVVGWMQRWNLYDSWRLHNYAPSSEVAQLATDTAMNDRSRRMFYAYHPELNDRQAFNQNCKSSEKTIVLGCYVSGTGIYVFAVQDERLKGVLQVTAAHEMLHAAYDRLNSKDKKSVDAMIEDAYSNVTDERIRKTIDDYRNNGADVNNELHSILGTEVRTLPSALESYYKRYFNDRSSVIGYSEKYETAFTERKNKVAEYDAKLDDLKKRIDEGQASLDAQTANLEAERARLSGLLAAKNYDEYNAGVNGYNAQVNAYNAQVRAVRGLIDEYNAAVAARNAIASEESDLVKAIDSRPSTLETE